MPLLRYFSQLSFKNMSNPSDSSSAICCLAPSSITRIHIMPRRKYLCWSALKKNTVYFKKVDCDFIHYDEVITYHCLIPSLRKETLGLPCLSHSQGSTPLLEVFSFAGHRNLDTFHTDGSSHIPVSAVQPF